MNHDNRFALRSLLAALACTAVACLSPEPGGRSERDVPPPDEGDERTELTLTRAVVSPYRPAEVGLCAGAPADLSGTTAWVDDVGLWLAPHEHASTSEPRLVDRLAPGEIPTSPVVHVSETRSAPILAVAVARTGTCALRLFDEDGAPRGALEVPATRCTNPSPSGYHLLWPLAGPTSAATATEHGRVSWVDPDPAREVYALELDAAPLTPAVAIGGDVLSGGGSHWLVGTSRGVIALHDPLGDRRQVPGETPDPSALPSVVGTWDEPAGRATSVVVVGDVAVVTLAGDGDEGLGARLRLLAIARGEDRVALTPLGDVVTAQGPLTAHPVALACDDDASHAWACPDGAVALVAAGGEGWLAGWYLPSGAPAFERTSPLTWTGISLGRGGWVAGGGSHWLPGEDERWRVVALAPLTPLADAGEVELAGGPGPACVPSPLWDSNGDLATPILGADGVDLVRSILTGVDGALGLASGSPRPHGTARNAGASATSSAVCDDGVARGLFSMPVGGDAVYHLLHGDGRTVVYGQRSGRGVVRRLPDDLHGASELVIDHALAVERAWLQPDNGVVVAFFDVIDGLLSGSSSLEAYRGTSLLWSHTIDPDLGSISGLVPGRPGEFLVAARQGSQDVVVRMHEKTGRVDARAWGDPTDAFGLARFVPDQASGAFMLLGLESALVLRRIGPDLAPLALATWKPPAPRTIVLPLDASVDGDGHLRVLVEAHTTLGGDMEMRWLEYDRDLVLRDDRGIPHGGLFATHPDGASLVASAAGLVRVSADGAVGLPRLASGWSLASAYGGIPAVAPTADGFVAAFTRRVGGGYELVWGYADRHGFLGCAEAGRCVGKDAAACDDTTPCAVKGCAPASGECEAAASAPQCLP